MQLKKRRVPAKRAHLKCPGCGYAENWIYVEQVERRSPMSGATVHLDECRDEAGDARSDKLECPGCGKRVPVDVVPMRGIMAMGVELRMLGRGSD